MLNDLMSLRKFVDSRNLSAVYQFFIAEAGLVIHNSSIPLPPLFPARNGPPVQAIGRLQQGAGWVAKPGKIQEVR